MNATMRFALTVLLVVAALLAVSTPAGAGWSGQTKYYEVVPVNNADSGGGTVMIQIGSYYHPKYKTGWWGMSVQMLDGVVAMPEYGVYYVYFDSELFTYFEASGWWSESRYLDYKPSFPRAIYIFDAEGNLVLYGKASPQ